MVSTVTSFLTILVLSKPKNRIQRQLNVDSLRSLSSTHLLSSSATCSGLRDLFGHRRSGFINKPREASLESASDVIELRPLILPTAVLNILFYIYGRTHDTIKKKKKKTKLIDHDTGWKVLSNLCLARHVFFFFSPQGIEEFLLIRRIIEIS